MRHVALYRTWRPANFKDVVGQSHVVQTLQNALAENRFTHAYLFCGPRGTGKTSAAKIFAKAINCEQGPAAEPCNSCSACGNIDRGAVMDVVEIDAASNRGVDEIREIREHVKYAPTEVPYKVYIIDEVHMLTSEAFNALLKTLEEPPKHVVFILATTEPHKIPATIISRCQRFDFRRISLSDQTKRIAYICEQEGIEAEEEGLRYIARMSEGAMRDALSLLDQVIAYGGNRVTAEQMIELTGGIGSEQISVLAEAISRKDVGAVLDWVEEQSYQGKSAERCMEHILQSFRDLLLIKMMPDAKLVQERVLDASLFQRLAEGFATEELFDMIESLSHSQSEMKYAAQPQLMLEVALLKLCHRSEDRQDQAPAPRETVDIGQWEQRIVQLEQKLTELMKGASGASHAHAPVSEPASIERSRSSQTASKPIRVSSREWEKMLPYHQGEGFNEACKRWNDILQLVKSRNITVHAWLVNGEPAAANEEYLLVKFKNDIHRETTEKPANRQMIEEAIQETLGKPLKLLTVMLKEWQERLKHTDTPSSPREEEAPPLEWEIEESNPPHAPEHADQEWVNKAIELFGEDLVSIERDDER